MTPGDFATSRRGWDSAALSYARELGEKGLSRNPAAWSRATGVPEDVLRTLSPPKTDAFDQGSPRSVTAATEAFAFRYRLSGRQIVRANRSPRFVPVRQGLLAYLPEATGLSLAEVGRQIGLHHTTIMHARDRHNARMQWVAFLRWAGQP
jgi:hypothetical protein